MAAVAHLSDGSLVGLFRSLPVTALPGRAGRQVRPGHVSQQERNLVPEGEIKGRRVIISSPITKVTVYAVAAQPTCWKRASQQIEAPEQAAPVSRRSASSVITRQTVSSFSSDHHRDRRPQFADAVISSYY
jgi:hypothetical protein